MFIEWFEDKAINVEELLKRKGESVKRIETEKEVLEFVEAASKLSKDNVKI